MTNVNSRVVGTALSLQMNRRTLNAALALLLLFSLCPVLLVPIPAMLDYPNHLARMSILSRAGTAAEHPMYQVAWAFYPNLAMDLIVPRLARFTSVETATRLFLLAGQLLIITGSMAFEYAVKGRCQIAGFAAALFLYSLPFAWGFVNFEFGLGLALWGMACWFSLQERPWAIRLAVHALFSALLFVAHLFAFGIYGLGLGMLELWHAWTKRISLREIFANLVMLALPALALFGMMTALGGAVGRSGTRWIWPWKLLELLLAVNGYNLLLSAYCGLILVCLLGILIYCKILRVEPAGRWLAVGFACLFLIIPSKLFDTSFVDIRILTAAALILPAFMSISFPSMRWRLGVAATLLAILSVNLGYALFVSLSYQREYKAIIASFERLQRGSRVLVGHSMKGENPSSDLYGYQMYHLPVLAVHYADAFVPTLFTSPGKQPVIPRPALRRLDIPYGGPVPTQTLKAIAEGKALGRVRPFIRSWQRDYDYLYVVGPRRPNLMPDLLEQMDAGPQFVLYKVRTRDKAS